MTVLVGADAAVIIAGHGDRGSADRNRALLGHAGALLRSGAFRHVGAGVLKGEPSLESALQDAHRSDAGAIVVYPFFMADGYFVRNVLADRIAAAESAARCRCTAPLGLDPDLPGVMLAEASSRAAASGFEAAACRLLVVGHGSRLGPASADATRRAAQRIATMRPGFATVETAFLEEAPFLDEALAATATPTVVSGFFSGDGLHAGEDVPEAIRQSGARAVYSGAVGSSAGVTRLILAAVAAALAA